jgi:hypothetical protein
MYPLQDHFDVAHLLGHPAFDHLALACSPYRWVHEHSLIDPSVHAWPQCLSYGAQLLTLRRAELKACVQAVVLFQAMMEKLPYFAHTVGVGLKQPNAQYFADSWNQLLDQISDPGDRAQAKAEFEIYVDGFYGAMRNPIIHGRKAADIAQVNSIRTPGVHAGMKAGWRAYDYILSQAFQGDGQTHTPSWSIMCDAHGVPADLDLAVYPDLGVLSSEYMKRHLEGAQAATSPKGTDGA